MKLAINLALSMAMLVVCVWLVWPSPENMDRIDAAIHNLNLRDLAPYLGAYFAAVAVNHFCRAWRWNNLLRPIGAELGGGRLLAISSVGFMAILALPARLGEFVRPALIRQKGRISASAALGTVAVERIVDGLIVSLFVFCAFFALRGPQAPGWMMPTAYAALGVFAAAMLFLGFALKWPDRTISICLRLSLLPRFAPRLAGVIEDKLGQLISGFRVLTDKRNLAAFVAWSLGYWIANGFSVWILARGFGLDLSLVGGFAVMGLVAVGITLPNAPGLVGQFQWFTVLGLTLYLPVQVAEGEGMAYAVVLHGLQVVWYMTMGALALATKHVSFAEVVASRRLDESPSESL